MENSGKREYVRDTSSDDGSDIRPGELLMESFEGEWKKRFERFGSEYTEDHRISGWSDAGLRRRVVVFKELLNGLNLASPLSVLELGCGGGTYVRLLASAGHRVVGLDYSHPSLMRAMSMR